MAAHNMHCQVIPISSILLRVICKARDWGAESTGHMKGREAFKSSSSKSRTWTPCSGKAAQPSRPLHGIRGIKCYCINIQRWLLVLSECQIPLFRCMEKCRSVPSAGRQLHCQRRGHFSIHLCRATLEYPGCSTCRTACSHSFLPMEQNKECWDLWQKSGLPKMQKTREKGGMVCRAALGKTEDGKIGEIYLQAGCAEQQWFTGVHPQAADVLRKEGGSASRKGHQVWHQPEPGTTTSCTTSGKAAQLLIAPRRSSKEATITAAQRESNAQNNIQRPSRTEQLHPSVLTGRRYQGLGRLAPARPHSKAQQNNRHNPSQQKAKKGQQEEQAAGQAVSPWVPRCLMDLEGLKAGAVQHTAGECPSLCADRLSHE